MAHSTQTINGMNIQQIMEHIPHRYPFLLIDRVLNCDPAEQIEAIKNVTVNEPFFSGHFPHEYVMPGVLIVEAMAQASAILALHRFSAADSKNNTFYFVGIDKVRFKKPVIPGDRLLIKSKIVRTIRGIWKFAAKVEVEESLVTEAQLMCTMKVP